MQSLMRKITELSIHFVSKKDRFDAQYTNISRTLSSILLTTEQQQVCTKYIYAHICMYKIYVYIYIHIRKKVKDHDP